MSYRLTVCGVAALLVSFALPENAHAAYSDWRRVTSPSGTGYCADPILTNGASTPASWQHLAVDTAVVTMVSCGYVANDAFSDYDGDGDMFLEQGSLIPGGFGAPAPAPFHTFGTMPASPHGNCAAGIGATTAGPGYGAFVSDAGSGHVYAARNDGSLWFWNGSTWTLTMDPYVPQCGGRSANSIYVEGLAAVSDTLVYALSGDGSCYDGFCIQESVDGGHTFTTLDNSAQGAAAISYDPTTSKLWIVTDSGHVKARASICTFFGGRRFCTQHWVDVGETGLPTSGSSYGAVKIAVYDDVPWVIAISTSAAGGSVFSLNGTTWAQMGSITDANDIARDLTTGTLYVTRAATLSDPFDYDPSSNNIWRWTLIPS